MSMSWAIGFVTLERPFMAQRFVRSVRRLFPDVPLYVAEQSRRLGPMAGFYAAERVDVIRMPFDAGLSASRNALIDAMDVDFVALCDDDFILGPETSFESAIRVLERDRELGVVGGMLHDYDGVTETIRNWEMYLDHDERNRRFTATPIYNYPPVARQVAGETVYLCDAVLNFAMFRKALFSDRIRWEESIKVNGEHEDFYLNLRKHSHYRVAYLPAMVALHCKDHRQAAYLKLRSRDNGRHAFMEKWNLLSHLEIGPGGRPLDGTPVCNWFAGNGEETVNASFPGPAGISHRQLYSTVERTAVKPVQLAGESRSMLDCLTVCKLFTRGIAIGQLMFCYLPVIDPEEDMLLWVRTAHEPDTPVAEAGDAGIVLRWFSATGDVLVWESEVYTVSCSEHRYWQALSVNVPLFPAAASWLRFEIVSACSRRTPMATGFVFAGNMAAGAPDFGEYPGAPALCRKPVGTAALAVERKPLAKLLDEAPRVAIDVVRNEGQPWVTMDVSGFGFMGVAATDQAALPLVFASGLRHGGSTPVPLALPVELVMAREAILFAGDADPIAEQFFVIEPRLVDVMQDDAPDAAAPDRPDDTVPDIVKRVTA